MIDEVRGDQLGEVLVSMDCRQNILCVITYFSEHDNMTIIYFYFQICAV